MSNGIPHTHTHKPCTSIVVRTEIRLMHSPIPYPDLNPIQTLTSKTKPSNSPSKLWGPPKMSSQHQNVFTTRVWNQNWFSRWFFISRWFEMEETWKNRCCHLFPGIRFNDVWEIISVWRDVYSLSVKWNQTPAHAVPVKQHLPDWPLINK